MITVQAKINLISYLISITKQAYKQIFIIQITRESEHVDILERTSGDWYCQ